MHRLRRIIECAVISIVVTVQLLFPVVTFAQTAPDTGAAADPADTSQSVESTPDTTTDTPDATPTDTVPTDSASTPPTDTQTATGPTTPTGPTTLTGPTTPTGPQSPTGDDGQTYSYNAATGYWENDYYYWDPVTHLSYPKNQPGIAYNPKTGTWETTDWHWDAAKGAYVPQTKSFAAKPRSGGSLSASISNTGSGSNNGINLNGLNSAQIDLVYRSQVQNNIVLSSQSGDASVTSNTIGGNAGTGDAQSIANILNMLQSAWGTLGSDNIATFVGDVNGNVVGDITFDPSSILASASNSDIDVHVANDGQIDNTINVSATSGDALVDSNTKAGSATSGDATALVNLINMINSAIYANKSFVGILNINGDLEGDILLPPSLLQALIAATGANSNNQINAGGTTNVDVNVDTNRSITNQISADASSGQATVGSNTIAGDAITGAAENNLVMLNLTGQRVVAKNALVVFVNVLGSWVGLIMNAPAGTNAAITATGASSTNQINAPGDKNVDVDISENSNINNDITVSAHSGDASVTKNTEAGGATTGHAKTGVNILNMIDSDFNVSDWFGVLFINVFGTWHGSFGVNTPYGNAPAAGGMEGGSSATAAADSAATAAVAPKVFQFIPGSSNGSSGSNSNNGAIVASTSGSKPGPSALLAATNSKATSPGIVVNLRRNWALPTVTISMGIMLLVGERLINRKRLVV